MEKQALIFSGRNGLDFIELREGVIRIPEVSRRIRQAQSIFDSLDLPSVDLMTLLISDDEIFFRNIQMKGLLSAVVQVGLFDRYLRTQRRPQFMVGNSNGDSAMMVAAGLMSLEAMILESPAVASLRPAPADNVVPLVASAMPLLSGLSLTEYCALEAFTNEEGKMQYRIINDVSMDLRRLVASLHENQGVDCFINVGPAHALRSIEYRMLGCGDVESLDSIELDPMLNWFWKAVRPQALALAQ